MEKKIDHALNFQREVSENIKRLSQDHTLHKISLDWMLKASESKYSYNFSYLGRPIIQYPTDIVNMQELIWKVKPTLIIETGIAHGGSLVFSASMLALLEYCEAVNGEQTKLPSKTKRQVLGIDIEIRPHNRTEIEKHPLSKLIQMIEGSSTDTAVIEKVRKISNKHKKIMVLLDSNHSHEHVLEELRLYAPLVSKESYCIVFDTVIAKMPDNMFPDRNWDKSKNPQTAVYAYLKENSDFYIDRELHDKLQITVCPDGYLKRK